jgi:hypothetical protein
MSKFLSMCVIAGLLCCFAAPRPTLAAEGTKAESALVPDFAPDSSTAWTLDRPDHDDFLPPPSGPRQHRSPAMTHIDKNLDIELLHSFYR